MKKPILFSIYLTINLISNAQVPITWAVPVTVSSVNGFSYARICLANNNPVITWGDNANQSLMMSHKVLGSFTTPVQLSPAGVAVTAFIITGPETEARGDTVYVTYVDGTIAHAYLQRSFDGGNTFSDTVQVDNIGTDVPQYSSIAIQPDGNPVIAFARTDAAFLNPQYVVTKSNNYGASFLPEVSATNSLGADPCNCCPGSLAINGNTVAVIYRNAIADVRDFRCAISNDAANNFLSVGNIDTNNWVVANCPSSGGTAFFNGDSLVSVFMNGLTGAFVYVSTYNTTTHQLGIEKKIFDVAGTSQNFPRIAGSGDTLGVVWTQIINGSVDVMFSYSTTGAAGLGQYIDTVTLLTGAGFYNNPDIKYANGKFHIVFNDGASVVYYLEGTIGTPSSIESHSNSSEINIFLSDENATLNLICDANQTEKMNVKIYNVSGKLIEDFQLNGLQKSNQLKLQSKLTSGVYVVTVDSKSYSTSKQLCVVKP